MIKQNGNSVNTNGWSALRCVLLVAAALAVSGCASHYVDPTLPRVAVSELAPPAQKSPVQFTVQFMTVGKPNARGTEMVRNKVRGYLQASGFFSEVTEGANPEMPTLNIVMNNVGDLGSAFGKGFVTGLTFGLAGNMVTDGYVFDATFKTQSGQPWSRSYQHAIHTTVGNHAGPPGLQAVPIQQAFDTVLEQLVNSMLRDLRADRALGPVADMPRKEGATPVRLEDLPLQTPATPNKQ